MKFFQEVFKSSASEAIEDYRNLKENINSAKVFYPKSKVVYQYAEVRVLSNLQE